MWILTIIAGLFIVLLALFILRKELDAALNKKNFFERKISNTDYIKGELEELSSSFYDIANDLEGKFSQHEKQIEILESKLLNIEKLLYKIENHENTINKSKSINKEILENSIENISFTDKKDEKILVNNILISKEKKDLQSHTPQTLPGISLAKLNALKRIQNGEDISKVAREESVGIGELQLLLKNIQ